MNMNYFVYKLINPFTSLPFYIGKGQVEDNQGRKYERIRDHLSRGDKKNMHKYRTILKIRRMGKEPLVEIYRDCIDENTAFSLEVKLIKEYGRHKDGGILTNITEGGSGGPGYRHTEEIKMRWSLLRRGRNKGKENPFFGKKHTNETKEKIRKARLGTKLSQETKLKCVRYGKNCGLAKKFKFISPNGEEFIIDGGFHIFIQSRNLSEDTFKKYIDKGIIPPPTNPKHNRMSEERLNSTGWSVTHYHT